MTQSLFPEKDLTDSFQINWDQNQLSKNNREPKRDMSLYFPVIHKQQGSIPFIVRKQSYNNNNNNV